MKQYFLLLSILLPCHCIIYKLHYWQRKPYIWQTEDNTMEGIIPMMFEKAKQFCYPEYNGTIIEYLTKHERLPDFMKVVDNLDKNSSAEWMKNKSGFAWAPYIKEIKKVNLSLILSGRLKMHTISSIKSFSILVPRSEITVPKKLMTGFQDIAAILFTTGLFIITFGFLMWSLERRANKKFGEQIFNGIWWSQVTMTTTGYGDFVPITFFGKVLAIVCMFSGSLLVALMTSTVIDKITDTSQFALRKKMNVAVVKDTYEEMVAKRDFGANTCAYETYEDVYKAVNTSEVEAGLVNGDIASWDIDMINEEYKLAVVYQIPVYFPIAFISSLPKQFDDFKRCAFTEYVDETKEWTNSYYRRDLTTESFYMPSISDLVSMNLFITILTVFGSLCSLLALTHDLYKFFIKRREKTFKVCQQSYEKDVYQLA